jgi:hypothetical protein
MAKLAIMVQTVQITGAVSGLSYFSSHTCGRHSTACSLLTHVSPQHVLYIKIAETREQGSSKTLTVKVKRHPTSRRHIAVTDHYQVNMSICANHHALMIQETYFIAVSSERYFCCVTCISAIRQYSVLPTPARNQSLYPLDQVLDDKIFWVLFPTKAAGLSLLPQVQTGPRAHTASYAKAVGRPLREAVPR